MGLPETACRLLESIFHISRQKFCLNIWISDGRTGSEMESEFTVTVRKS
jgi:hypothetical protein